MQRSHAHGHALAAVKDHQAFARLRKVDAALRRGEDTGEPELVDVGLVLHPSVERAPYRSTPRNSLTFASTGGDGVHFGFLLVEDVHIEDSPIVMTVPVSFKRPNVVVGRDLVDFLALGCRRGFSELEGLAYGWRSEAIARYESVEPARAHHAVPLDALSKEFALQPWKHVEATLARLELAFAARLDVRASTKEAMEEPPLTVR